MATYKRAISGVLAAVFGLLLLAGCSDEGGGSTGGGAGGGSGGATGAGGGASSTTGDPGCGMSFCGCWEDTTIQFAAKVLNGQTMDPVAGIEVYCGEETDPVGVSDAMGNVSFSVETKVSPGCGLERCNQLRFHDPVGSLADTTGSYNELNGKDVIMSYKPD
jgi:hypothetical protein